MSDKDFVLTERDMQNINKFGTRVIEKLDENGFDVKKLRKELASVMMEIVRDGRSKLNDPDVGPKIRADVNRNTVYAGQTANSILTAIEDSDADGAILDLKLIMDDLEHQKQQVKNKIVVEE